MAWPRAADWLRRDTSFSEEAWLKPQRIISPLCTWIEHGKNHQSKVFIKVLKFTNMDLNVPKSDIMQQILQDLDKEEQILRDIAEANVSEL